MVISHFCTGASSLAHAWLLKRCCVFQKQRNRIPAKFIPHEFPVPL